LRGERGTYRLVRPLPAIQVPATVQAVLAARIDRLPPEDKAMLQMASVVGKDIPVALLQAIAEPPEDELRAALGRLQAAEFLYETGLFPDLEYTFKHALTRSPTRWPTAASCRIAGAPSTSGSSRPSSSSIPTV
jgi:predicted ATPase